jgi:hypothetical protein
MNVPRELFKTVLQNLLDDMLALKQIPYDSTRNLEDQLSDFAEAKLAEAKNPSWLRLMKIGLTTFIRDPELAKETMAKAEDLDDVLTKNRVPARTALYYHLVINCNMSVTHVAGLIGVLPMTISNGIARFKIKIEEYAWISEIIKDLQCKVTT